MWVVSAEELTLGGHARARKQRGAPGSSHAAADQVEPEGGAEGWGRPNDIRGGAVAGLRSGKSTTQNGNGDEVEGEGGEKGIRGIAKKLWMGDERPGWQKRRLEKEKEELESGRGYGGIIMDQVREVFPSFAGRREGEEESEGGGEG